MFYEMKRQTIKNYVKYPPSTDCNSVGSQFGNNINNPSYQLFAKYDWDVIKGENTGIGVY